MSRKNYNPLEYVVTLRALYTKLEEQLAELEQAVPAQAAKVRAVRETVQEIKDEYPRRFATGYFGRPGKRYKKPPKMDVDSCSVRLIGDSASLLLIECKGPGEEFQQKYPLTQLAKRSDGVVTVWHVLVAYMGGIESHEEPRVIEATDLATGKPVLDTNGEPVTSMRGLRSAFWYWYDDECSA